MLELIKHGGPIMYPLIALSFIAIVIVVERALFWARADKGRDHALVEQILTRIEAGDYDGATDLKPGTNDFIARTLLNGLRHRFYSLTLALETQAMIELKKMRRNLVILDTIITAAPLLGILGTVIGIILSFDVLGSVGIQDPKAVTEGISQALITTAYGLSIAILTIFPYNFFNTRYEESTEELEKHASTLEMLAHRKHGPHNRRKTDRHEA